MALYDMKSSAEYWQTLLSEANWSKCVYTYGACCLAHSTVLELASDEAMFRFGLQPRPGERRDELGGGEKAYGHSAWAHAANSREIDSPRGMFTHTIYSART
jgi:hypothetical protein